MAFLRVLVFFWDPMVWSKLCEKYGPLDPRYGKSKTMEICSEENREKVSKSDLKMHFLEQKESRPYIKKREPPRREKIQVNEKQ